MARYEGRMRLISETNINIANNTSYVTVAFDVRCVDSNWWPWNQNGNAYWKITVDGQTSGNVYFSFKWSLQAGQWKEVARKSFTITHTANGSKTINMSGYVFLDVTPSSISGSGSATLQTIPRASSIGNINGNTIGSQMTININSHSNSFTHRFWYKMGGSNWIEVTVPAGSSSITFTPTMNLCSQIPNSTSGTLQLSLRTMQGSTQIGADQNKNVTAYVPSSIVPSINNLSISEAVSGISQQFNSFVQGNSKLRVKTSSGGSYGSTIKNIAIECDGRKYNGADITTEVINASGQVAIKTIVTDSRGRTTTLTKNVTVIEYHGIQILGFAAKRCAPDGTEKDDGISLSLGINFKIASVGNKNTKNYVVEIQKDGNANSWTQVANGSVYVLNGNIVAKNVVDQDFTYKVRLKVSDYFSSVQVENQIGTSFSLMDFNASGKGIAFGKASEKDEFEVNLVAEFLKQAKFEQLDFSVLNNNGTKERHSLVEVWSLLSNINKNIFPEIRTYTPILMAGTKGRALGFKAQAQRGRYIKFCNIIVFDAYVKGDITENGEYATVNLPVEPQNANQLYAINIITSLNCTSKAVSSACSIEYGPKSVINIWSNEGKYYGVTRNMWITGTNQLFHVSGFYFL